MKKRISFFIFILFALIMISAQDKDEKAQSILEYIDFIKNNTEDFDIISGDGYIYANDGGISGGYYVNYYYQKNDSLDFSEGAHIMTVYDSFEDGVNTSKLFLFQNDSLLYYREKMEGNRNFFVEYFLENGEVFRSECKGCDKDFDISSYLTEVKKEAREEEY